jgi:hypothetical protein
VTVDDVFGVGCLPRVPLTPIIESGGGGSVAGTAGGPDTTTESAATLSALPPARAHAMPTAQPTIAIFLISVS